MAKYLKIMFGNKGINYEYKIGEVNIADTWNPNATNQCIVMRSCIS